MVNSELPSFDFVVPLTMSDDGARVLAEEACRSAFGMSDFDIMEISIAEAGDIETPNGIVEGKRYIVVYRNNLPH
jgi:hypothetical protein